MRETLAHFRLLEVLGEGGMGVVYKALDTRTGNTVALKILSHQSLLAEEVKRRFLREAGAGMRLTHPTIVKIYEVGEEDGEHFISMEYVEGKTLHQVLESGPMDPAQVVSLGIAVGDALREAHRQGIIHRDIKSANIMLSAGGSVKVMDFGLAKIQDASMLTREGEMLGTVTYMSPEQATGEAVDHRTDIFSLGVVLYELLVGKLPFGEQYELAVVYSILNVEPASICELRPEVPEALETIIFKALRKDLQYRYQNVDDLLGDLRRMKAYLDGKRDAIPANLELVAGTDIEGTTSQISHFTSGRKGGFEAKFTGRHDEFERLKELLHKAECGEGQTVFVTGEAGVGKSKLVEELETYARTMKMRPVNTRCVFREGAFAYRPFVEIIRDILMMKGATTADEIAACLRDKSPAVIPHIPILQAFLSVASGESALLQSKDQIWEAVLRFVEAVARERTLLLFIDDLQWADEETLRLLQYLSRNTSGAPVMLLGTYRPEDLDGGKAGHLHPLLVIEGEMIQERCLSVVRLERLKETDITQMICSLFPNAEFSKTFFDTVYRESEGNPLFVMEMLKLLKLEGVIHKDAGAFRLRSDVASLSMPSRIQDIVARRVTRLDRHEREVLEIGAVEGEVFHSDTIIRCLEAGRLPILRTLQSLERDYHIIHAQEKTYRFDHAKIRETLYDTLAPELRSEYHRMIGEYLAATYADDAQLAPNIALHFMEAGEEEKSVPFLITAARRAQTLFANSQAIYFYEQAGRIARSLERSRQGNVGEVNAGILEGLGEVCALIGNHDQALESFRALLLESGITPIRRADILQKIGQVLLGKGDLETTLEVLMEARGLLDSADLSSIQDQDVNSILGKTLITRARVFKSRGEYDEAARLIEQGLLLLGEQGHVRERADALNDLGNILEDRSENERAQEMFRRSLALREQISDKKGIAITYNNLANIFCAQGDYPNAAAMFSKSLELMKEIGFRAGIAGTCNNLGTIYQDQGRSREALEMYKKGLRVREEIGDRPGIAMSYGNMGFVSLDLGDFTGAKEYLREERQPSGRNRNEDVNVGNPFMARTGSCGCR